jgi:hypothetical protein
MNVVQANLKYKNPLTPLNPDNVQYIIIHHAEAVKATPEQIHQWHLQNEWSGAGYSEYITKDGTVHIMRGDNIGAHCATSSFNYNDISYGICCEGNYEIEKDMPITQYQALVERIKYHKARFKNLKKIGGHKEFIPTACPGRYFPLDKVKMAVNTNMPVLKQGMHGESVKFLQIQLNRVGYRLVADGIFGTMTKTAVMDYQRKNNLDVDGIVGTFTWSRLI